MPTTEEDNADLPNAMKQPGNCVLAVLLVLLQPKGGVG